MESIGTPRETGSSPRTRGTAMAIENYVDNDRFIPAHAGNRLANRASRVCPSVHPRARGEQFQRSSTRRHSRGSSPRTRGTAPTSVRVTPTSRFIPAHAGNSCERAPLCPLPSVHPRARGEQNRGPAKVYIKGGSSPRTRGTGWPPPPTNAKTRFIPAHAGNRVSLARCSAVAAVHPRARGEQQQQHRQDRRTGGSSPRTRGTDFI